MVHDLGGSLRIGLEQLDGGGTALPAAAGIVRVARADEVAQRGDRHFCIGVGIDETI